MNNPGLTKTRIHSLRNYGFSLAVHAVLAGCVVVLAVFHRATVRSGDDVVFTIESDADATALAAALAQLDAEPQTLPPEAAAPQVAEMPEKKAGVSEVAKQAGEPVENHDSNARLLADLPGIVITNEQLAQPGLIGEKQFQQKDWLAEAGDKKPVVVASNTTVQASDPMDAYFAVFVQSIRDAYRRPENLEERRQLSVRLRYEVAADGTIGTVSIVRSSGSASYDQSVVNAFRTVAGIGPRPDARSSVKVADFCLVN